MLYRFTRKLTTYPYYTILGIFITALILDESIIKILIVLFLSVCVYTLALEALHLIAKRNRRYHFSIWMEKYRDEFEIVRNPNVHERLDAEGPITADQVSEHLNRYGLVVIKHESSKSANFFDALLSENEAG